MSKFRKTLESVIYGFSDANIAFDDLCSLLDTLGFQERRKGGSHRVFTREGIEEIINIQPKGGKAKTYQVKQVRNIILKYRLGNVDE